MRRAFSLCCSLLCVCVFGALAGAFVPVAAADSCPNAAFRTGPSTYLPDCRAYEMVTPVQKNGAYINEGSFVSSPEGESVGFTSNTGFAGATSNLGTSTGYQASREGEAGWNTTAQTQSQAQFFVYSFFLERDYLDESFGNVEARLSGREGASRLWLMRGLAQPESEVAFYLTGLPGAGSSNVEVGPAVPPTASGLGQTRDEHDEQEEFHVRGMSADGLHMVFEDPEPAGPNQWSFGAPGALLEYAGTGNSEPMPVGVDDSGKFVNNCPQQLLGGTKLFNHVGNPISSDGRRIFFTDACQGELFARVDNGESDQHTVAISEPSSAECSACDTVVGERQAASFVGASEDGSKAFFQTTQPLLDGMGGLYEYDFDAPEGEKVKLVAPGSLTVLRVSEDGSHVYFLSTKVLTAEPSPSVRGKDSAGDPVEAGAVAQPGQNNMYVFEQDGRYPSGHVAFVATLAQEDGGSQGVLEYAFSQGVLQYNDATPDGRFFVFVTHAELTSDDTSTATQVFEYDAQTGNIVRVSIGEHGYNDNGNTYLTYPGSPYNEGKGSGGDESYGQNSNDALIVTKGEGESTFYPSSYVDHLSVSADGAYVFFQSPDGLTPQALNRVLVSADLEQGDNGHTAFATNVYEYHDGNVYLISDGQDTSTHYGSSQVHLLTTSLSGRDAFFETTDELVGQDTDSNKDIYDARIDGGFPAPAQPVSCSADACQGPLSAAPVLLSPGSEFQAGGNPPRSAPKQAASKPVVKARKKPKKRKVKTKKAKAKARRSAKRVLHGRADRKAGRS
jgi:hypothetical protein